jgi:hypothetical protein
MSLIACSSSAPADPPLGQATVRVDGSGKTVTAAWAELDYGFFGNANDSYGVYTISYTADAAADGLTCSKRGALTTTDHIYIDTPQVYHSAPGPAPVLSLGDIPVVMVDPTTSAPSSPVATMSIEGVISVTGGTITIAAFDTQSIQATFSATGSNNVAGELDVPICAPLHGH